MRIKKKDTKLQLVKIFEVVKLKTLNIHKLRFFALYRRSSNIDTEDGLKFLLVIFWFFFWFFESETQIYLYFSSINFMRIRILCC